MATGDVGPPVPFQGTNYDYKVGLGVVLDRDAISWTAWVRCNGWSDVETVARAWQEIEDHPAVQVKLDYIPRRVTEADDAE